MRIRVPMLALAAVAACATSGGTTSPPGPPPFQGVRTIALVRWVDDRHVGGKDALDALRESLDARGYQTRLVEVGPRGKGTPEAERLFREVDRRVASGAGHFRVGHVERAGKDAAAGVAAIGVDAVAMVHRLTGQIALPADPFGPTLPGTPFGPEPPQARYRPVGAMSLVNAAGDLTWVDWGSSPVDAGAPENAIEAIDALLRVLGGQPAESSADDR